MAKIHAVTHQDGSGQIQYWFHCPGCKIPHAFTVPPWTWNGKLEKPTFRPSLLCNRDHAPSRCHLWMSDGEIIFLQDCHHELRGQVVPIPEWTEDW